MVRRFSLLAVTGLAIALSAQSLAQAQTSPKLNPCPGLYYEAPLNERFLSPEGCPPNAARQAEVVPSRSSSPDPVLPPVDAPLVAAPRVPADSTVQPLPEELSAAIARVTPMANGVNVTFTNETNALITYEVIGQTDIRTLGGGETVVLRGLSLPTTISAVRNDSGLLNFTPSLDGDGQLQVLLDANPQFNEVQGVLQIQEDGEVFLN